jgi:cell division protein ZapA (FtsZ GTPase activity inhibitor)
MSVTAVGGKQAAKKVTVPVKIMGESFLITGSQAEEFVISLAKELDGRLTDARKNMSGASSNRVAISLALELLAELRAEKKKTEGLLEAFERS